MDAKAPRLLALAGGGLLLLDLLLFPPYTPRAGQWQAYTQPARDFLRAAISRDSQALVLSSGSPDAVAWGLAAARRFPDSLSAWARHAEAWTAVRRGDTVEVLYSTRTGVCEDRPIWLRFLSHRGRPKVVQAGSACFGPETPPSGFHLPSWGR
jgi:hypothetical protein